MTKEDELVEFYLDQRNQGMDFSEIRKALKNEKHSDDEIKEVIRKIDFKLINQIKPKDIKTNGVTIRLIGWFIFLLGLVITIITYFNWIDLGEKYIIAIGPVLSGLALIGASYRRSPRGLSPQERFKRK